MPLMPLDPLTHHSKDFHQQFEFVTHACCYQCLGSLHGSVIWLVLILKASIKRFLKRNLADVEMAHA